MSREAIEAATRSWNNGQSIVEAVLLDVERGAKPKAEVFHQMRSATQDLRKDLRSIEADVKDLDAYTWSPWRAFTLCPLGEGPIGCSEDLEELCRMLLNCKEGCRINWLGMVVWVNEVREWFGQLAEASNGPGDRTTASRPKQYLWGWPAILSAVGQNDDPETRRRVSRLNKMQDGPIHTASRGSRPGVDESELLAWWDKILIAHENKEKDREGRRLETESEHAYGREGVVFPGIRGHQKRRRKDRRP